MCDDGSVVGLRILSNGMKGTIKWTGEVGSTQGTWYGVDWDNEERGKHNGNHNGIKYFDTRTDKSGSFIRPQKVEFGITFEEAVRGRYQDDTKIDDKVTTDLQRTIKARFVELVGMEKVGKQQSELNFLRVVVLDGWPMSNGGDSDLRSLFPALRELDISSTLLPSWEAVAQITVQLPNLKSLNVSGNLMQLPADPSTLIESFEHITQLIMNHMLTYSWEDLLLCFCMFPKLTKLQLSHNKLLHMSHIPEGQLQFLEEIDLGVNHFCDWEEICYLGYLPRLKKLNLNSCKVVLIEFPDAPSGSKTALFPSLTTMMISNNPLKAWESVGELDKIQNLIELIITLEVVLESYFLEFTFARIYSLKMLNRTLVTQTEKRDFQMFYVRSFSNEYFSSGGCDNPDEASLSAEFIKNHPTYLTLIKEFGAPTDERGYKSQKSQKIRDLKMSINITIPDRADLKDETKSFMPNAKVSKVKMMIKRLFKLSPSVKIKLTYAYVKDDETHEFELDNDFHDLEYYSVSSGDTIVVRLS